MTHTNLKRTHHMLTSMWGQEMLEFHIRIRHTWAERNADINFPNRYKTANINRAIINPISTEICVSVA